MVDYLTEVIRVCYEVFEPVDSEDDPRTVVGIVKDTLAIKDKEIARLKEVMLSAIEQAGRIGEDDIAATLLEGLKPKE